MNEAERIALGYVQSQIKISALCNAILEGHWVQDEDIVQLQSDQDMFEEPLEYDNEI